MNNNKRNSLKLIALSAAASNAIDWQKPVIESVALPAHAAMTGCSLPEGCYNAINTGISSFFWPGGSGPTEVATRGRFDCEGNNVSFQIVVVADSLETAEAQYPNNRVVLRQTAGVVEECFFFNLFEL